MNKSSIKIFCGVVCWQACVLGSLAQPSVYSGAFTLSEGDLSTTAKQQTITNFVNDTQKDVSIINFFMSWTSGSSTNPTTAFPTTGMNYIRSHGSIPLLTWEPWNPANGVNQSFTLANITNGTYDAFISGWAAGAKNWGYPFFLRFAHEMNGTWYPWCAGVNGNTASQYVQAWRHVHDLFLNAGATNITWVWCVNTVYSTSTPIDQLYPGDNYVDWISLDGYNRLANPWQDFSTLAAPTVTQLTNLVPGKPIMVAETGCNQTNNPSGAKTQWFLNALTNYLPAVQPRIKAWVYFNSTNSSDGNDWRITVPAGAVVGYQQGIGLSYYASNQYGVVNSPIQPLLNDASLTDVMGPFVSITSPSIDTVTNGSVINFLAQASDKSGVSKVVFSVNGVFKQTNSLAPYQFFWNVPYLGVATYSIAATAYDSVGNTAVSTVKLVSSGPAITNILQTVTQTTGMDWNNSSWGSPAAAPVNGHNYETPGGFFVRTPNNINPTAFAGDSLQIDGGGVLYLKNGGLTAGTPAVVNLILNGGTMMFHGGFAPNGPAVGGTLQVLADSTINTDQTGANAADIWLQSAINGSGHLTVNLNNTTNSLLISGNNSAYAGNWTNASVYGNLNIPSGTLNPLGSGNVVLVNLGSGLLFNSTNDFTLSNAIGGAGFVIKDNTNVVALSGSCTFTGPLQIRNGTLRLGTGSSIANTSAIQLFSNAVLNVAEVPGGFIVGGSQTLSGNGSVIGDVAMNGVLRPGPFGTMSFANNLTLSGTTVMELNRTNSPNADLVSATSVILGGTLTVTNLGGTLQAGDSFHLFSGAINGAFSVTNLPALNSTNLFWDTSKLSSQGILAVGIKPASPPTIFPPIWTAASLTIQSDSESGYHYVLQVSPQLVPAQWFDLQTNAGGGTLTFTVPVYATNAQQFYRLLVW